MTKTPRQYSNNPHNNKYLSSDVILERTCEHCGKTIWVKNKSPYVYCTECANELKYTPIQLYTSDGKKYVSEKTKRIIKEKALKRVEEGIHKGWTSRNITSYPEQFWKTVLDNNNIKYNFNAVVPKQLLGLNDASSYFLDFLIGDNIDLEIDGKQHGYTERSQKDIQRDETLIKNGYIVYRIAWNEIVSEEGSKLMKQKIDKFLAWLKNTDKEEKYLQNYEVPTKYTYTCRICGKIIKTNTKKRHKYFYCSKECSNKGIHLPKNK